MGRFFFSLRFRLTLLVLFAVLPALGVTFYSGLEQRRIVAMQAKEESLRSARLVSTHQNQLVEGSRHFLYMLAQLSQVQNCDPASCSSLFANLMKQYPWFLNIGAVYPDGNIFASALPQSQPVNIADRSYFRLALKTRKFSIGDYQIGRIHGKPSVNFGYPVLDRDGRVKAVVFVSLCLDWLNQLSTRANLPSGSTLTVIDHNGVILARHPDPKRWVGKTMGEASIVKTILSQREGMAEATGVDGVSRLYAFTEFGGTGQAESMYLSIGTPTSVAFTQVDWTLKRNLILLVFIGLIALVAIWVGGDLLVLRRLNPIMRAARQLGAGDLGARTGIVYGKGELSQLAFTFDEMAHSLEKREDERRHADEELRSSEKKYRELANLLPDVVFETDEKGNLTFANQNAFDAFGYTLNDFDQGLSVFQMLVLEDQDKAREIFLKALEGEKLDHEYTMNRKDGSKFFAIIHPAPIIRDGHPVGLRGIVVDITERKRAEEALRESEERYKTIFRTTGAATVIVEEDTTISLVNTEFEKLTGYSKEEIEGKRSWTEFIDKEHLERMKEYHNTRRIDSNLAPRSYESNFVDRNGNMRDVFITVSMIPGTKKSVASILDVTESKRTEREMSALQEQLRQSQKMEAVGRLAGGIAHDFNNSLTVIKGYSQLSVMELKQDDPLRGNIEEIQKAAERAANLTRQLLAFSRRQVLEMKVLDLNTSLKDVDKMLRRIIGEDIELVTLLADDLGKVKTDPGQIEQVIMNLAVNARDAMPNGGKLTIETVNVILDEEYARNHVAVKPGHYVMLSVSDTGCGMGPEVKERIFEPFFTTKEKGKGTGLGLSTVYGIVKQSGGNIWLYSEPGHGTTFKIYLPSVDEPIEEVAEKAAIDEIPRGNETILIVEDDEAVRKLAVRVLEKQGYTVLESHQEFEAMSFCKEREDPIHLILMDVVMPEMSGRQLIESLKQMRQDFKVLYMSGYTDNAIVHHGVLEKGVNFIQKPFTFEGLARKVREVLDK